MSSGRNPNWAQKQLLTKCGKNYTEWLLTKTLSEKERTIYQFRHRTNNETIRIDNNGNEMSN